MPPGEFRISDIGKATQTKVETVRYYEHIGLLPAPARTQGNYRAYSTEHLNRLSFIRRARDLGFALDEVRELLGLADQTQRSCDAVDRIARDHLADIERKIADLTAVRAELDTVIGQCRAGTIAECRIIHALAPAQASDRDDLYPAKKHDADKGMQKRSRRSR